ncbi:MAG: hypothetical protein HY329_13475, partial [Chloroflexi bacterium]|nr:hypothetical protein [Chloroflexota bacterium]
MKPLGLLLVLLGVGTWILSGSRIEYVTSLDAGTAAEAEGRLATAVDTYDRATRLAINSATPRVRLGELWLRRGRPDLAEPELATAAGTPGGQLALPALAESQLATDKLAAASATLAAANGLIEPGRVVYLQGELALRRRELDRAYDRYARATQLGPPVWGQRAALRAAVLDLEERSAHLLRALSGPDQEVSATARRYEADLAVAAGLSDEAHRAALTGLAALRAGVPAVAQAELRHALALRPDYGEARAYLGAAAWRLGGDDTARAELMAAVATSPDSAVAQHLFGLWLLAHGQGEAALEPLRRATQLTANDASVDRGAALLDLARAYIAAGRFSNADDAFERALFESVDSFPVLLARAQHHADRGYRPTLGVEVARQAVSQRPDDPEALAAFGWLLYLNGRLPEALAALDRAVERGPELASAHYWYALALER